MKSSSQTDTVVLVHGAWADGSCWNNVILPLKSRGLNVTCAQISLTSFEDDVATLRRVVERASGPVILAAHAYGGSVIGGVSDDRVKSLVYIAGLAPDEGETVADVFFRTAPHPSAPQMSPDADGLIWMPEDGFAQAIAHNASSDQLEIMSAVQRPISVNCIQVKVPVPAWKSKPSWFLRAEEDRMISLANQQFMAERMGANIRSYKVDHSPMYSKPDLVVDIILEAAQSTSTK